MVRVRVVVVKVRVRVVVVRVRVRGAHSPLATFYWLPWHPY